MDNNDNNWGNWIWAVVIIGIVWALFSNSGKYEGRSAQEWFEEYDYESARNDDLESKISEYEAALQEANNNIEEANNAIESAKSYAWESYEEMGDALDYLDTVDTVSEP